MSITGEFRRAPSHAKVVSVDLYGILDNAAHDLHEHPDQTYEVAASLALGASRCAADEAWGDSAALIRDVFGTYVEQIHGFRGASGEEEATLAHQHISTALAEWGSSGRTDLADFARRWRSRVSKVDTTWLTEQQRAQPMRRSGWAAKLRNPSRPNW